MENIEIKLREEAKRLLLEKQADVIIVNAALYGAHLSTGRTLLPAHDAVVFDEAHELDAQLSRSLGVELSAARLRSVSSTHCASAAAPPPKSRSGARPRSAMVFAGPSWPMSPGWAGRAISSAPMRCPRWTCWSMPRPRPPTASIG